MGGGKMKFHVWFASPRGFWNEGTFLYGTQEQYDELMELVPSGLYAWTRRVSSHRTEGAASASARRQWKDAGAFTGMLSLEDAIHERKGDAELAEMAEAEHRRYMEWMSETYA